LGQILWNALLIFKTTFWLTLVLHCLACFWVWVGHYFEGKSFTTWILFFELENLKNREIYVNALELMTCTFTTIGYGSTYAVA